MALNLGGLFRQSSGALPSGALGSGSNTVYDLLNPSNARNALSGLMPGGTSSLPKAVPNIGFQNATGQGGASAASEDDWRVRVSLAPGARIFYQDPVLQTNALMFSLLATNGVIFPYTPTINVSHTANYSTARLTHSNYPAHFYNNSEVADIQISGEFTVQNIADGQYLMAVIYFFRSATKMFFGTGDNVGNPPPIVFLDGYGSHYFPHVPCVLSQFNHTMPNEVDYVQIPITHTELDSSPIDPNRQVNVNNLDPNASKYIPTLLQSQTQATTVATQATVKNSRTKAITTTTRLPTLSTVSITLRPVYSRQNLHERFDLNKFANGYLLQDKETGFGGFI